MAEQGPSIFNRKAAERLRSPDDLDKYVRVTSPSVWVVLVACVALLAGLLAWGVFGTVSSSLSALGVVIDGEAMCFLPADDVALLHEGDPAYFEGRQLEVAQVATIPLSRAEGAEVLGSDYLVDTLFEGDWAYQVTLGGDTEALAEGVPATVTVTTERVAPITLVLGE